MALSSAQIAALVGAGIISNSDSSILVTIPRTATIEAIGDSTVAGFSTGGGVSQVANSWPSKLASIFAGNGISATAQNRFGCASATWAALLAMDGRVSSTGSWQQSGALVGGGNGFQGNADNDTATFALGSWTKFIVHWVNSTAGRVFSYSVDGGAAVDVTAPGVTYEPRTTVITAPAGVHTVTITRKSGAIVFRGVEAYDDTNGVPMRILNLGISGATSAQMIDNTDATIGRRVQYGQLAPTLAIIEGGIINDWRQSVPIATSKANLTTLVQTLKAANGGACKVMLLTPVFDNSTTGASASQELYVAAMREVAAEQSVPILDIRPIFQSWAYANSQGWMSDDVHPSAAGYAVIAGAIARSIRVSA